MASPERDPSVCATLGEQPMDVCFHPTRALVAAGLITGVVELFAYTATSAGEVTSHAVHTESCRAVRFLAGGGTLVSGGADSALAFTDVDTGALLARVPDAHAAAINRLTVLSETVLATGAWRLLCGLYSARVALKALEPPAAGAAHTRHSTFLC
jgi:WD40 repeat protein